MHGVKTLRHARRVERLRQGLHVKLPPTSNADQEEQAVAFLKQLDVLVVDDTNTSRALMCGTLDEIGILNHRIAKDGEEALKMMMVKPAPLVISDMAMPKLDGLGLLKALRQYAPTKNVGFILVTGLSDKTIVQEGKKYGLNNFLMKPFTAQSLRACIEAVTGKLV